jgi:hypothetical protein
MMALTSGLALREKLLRNLERLRISQQNQTSSPERDDCESQ